MNDLARIYFGLAKLIAEAPVRSQIWPIKKLAHVWGVPVETLSELETCARHLGCRVKRMPGMVRLDLPDVYEN